MQEERKSQQSLKSMDLKEIASLPFKGEVQYHYSFKQPIEEFIQEFYNITQDDIDNYLSACYLFTQALEDIEDIEGSVNTSATAIEGLLDRTGRKVSIDMPERYGEQYLCSNNESAELIYKFVTVDLGLEAFKSDDGVVTIPDLSEEQELEFMIFKIAPRNEEEQRKLLNQSYSCLSNGVVYTCILFDFSYGYDPDIDWALFPEFMQIIDYEHPEAYIKGGPLYSNADFPKLVSAIAITFSKTKEEIF